MDAVYFPADVLERLVDVVRQRYPRKTFGYLLSDEGPTMPNDFVIFEENIRNETDWKVEFESYGQYFVDHDDAGFVATPEEAWRVQKAIWQRGRWEVGVFHSHQRHPANFSLIDYDMHRSRVDDLWHLIISMRNPALPQLRAFAVTGDAVSELPVRTRQRVPA